MGYEGKGKIRVSIDPDLRDLVPGFLENRRRDVHLLLGAIERQDFEIVRMVGHRLKGDGGGYGFQAITELGAALETAARHRHLDEIHRHVTELASYLERIEVVYDESGC